MIENLQQSADRINTFAQGAVRFLGGATMLLAGACIARESAKLGIDTSHHETLQAMIPTIESLGCDAGLFLAGAALFGPAVNQLDRLQNDVPGFLKKSGQQG